MFYRSEIKRYTVRKLGLSTRASVKPLQSVHFGEVKALKIKMTEYYADKKTSFQQRAQMSDMSQQNERYSG